MRLNASRLLTVFILLAGVGQLSQMCSYAAQEPDDGEKGIRAQSVMGGARKAASSPSPARPRTPQPDPTYTASKKRPKGKLARTQEDVRMGLTIFRFEPAGTIYTDKKDGTKDIGLVGSEAPPEPPAKTDDWRLSDWARATVRTQFAVGQFVRLHLEPLTQSKYFYIIHQELYADGTSGPAKLLFPMLSLNGGDNFIRMNGDLWVPRAPASFHIKPSSIRSDHVGELITIVVRDEGPGELLPRPIGQGPMPLSDVELKKLVRGAVIPVNELNLDGGEGTRQSPRDGTKDVVVQGDEAPLLTDDDALPQTIFEARRRKGQPILVRIPLRFKTEAAPPPQKRP